jgi:hypothetical protein
MPGDGRLPFLSFLIERVLVDYPRGAIIDDERIGPARIVCPDQAVAREDVQVSRCRRHPDGLSQSAVGRIHKQAPAPVGDINVARRCQRRTEMRVSKMRASEPDRRYAQVSSVDKNKQLEGWRREYRDRPGLRERGNKVL